MPARANITINDGAATPVAHTFNPAEDGDFDVFEDRVGGIAIGFPVILIHFKRPSPTGNVSSSDKMYRVQSNVNLPVLEVTSPSTGTGIQPAPTVAYVLRHQGTWMLPQRSTLQNRKDLRAFVANLYGHADFKKVVEDLDPFY